MTYIPDKVDEEFAKDKKFILEEVKLKAWYVEWFTPERTIEILNILTADGLVRHDPDRGEWHGERYVYIGK